MQLIFFRICLITMYVEMSPFKTKRVCGTKLKLFASTGSDKGYHLFAE